MDKNIKIGIFFLFIGGITLYWNMFTWIEITMHILMLLTGIVVIAFSWKIFIESMKAGLRKVEEWFNPTLNYQYDSPQPAREPVNSSRDARENVAKSFAKPFASESQEIFNVSESKEFEIVNETIKFLTDNTKEGKLWLNANKNINHNLLRIADKCQVPKIAVVQTIKRYPDDFVVRTIEKEGYREEYAYSVAAYSRKQEETETRQQETGVRFDSTRQPAQETREKVIV